MKVGFVFTNYNNSAYTRAAVASLRQGGAGDQARVVIVDNQSNQDDVEALREIAREYPAVELILNPENVGYFKGLNVGIRRVREQRPELDHIVVGNNDLVFPANFVDAMWECRAVLDTHAVVAPDLVTRDGVHQNPHVLFPIGAGRKLVWDLYFLSYVAAVLIRSLASYTRPLTVRRENARGSDLYRTPGPIEQAYGACYILGPVFFRHFDRLCAPTFIMEEEFFLNEQLNAIGQMVYYDPRLVVQHYNHATTSQFPSRRQWAIAREAHRVYKRYLRLSPPERERMIRAESRMDPVPDRRPAGVPR